LPAQSQDLNHIEKIWSIIKGKIFDRADEIDPVSMLKTITEQFF
jgi:hypothetical protein